MRTLLSSFCLLCLGATPMIGAVDIVPLYSYWDASMGTPFWTTNFNEAKDGSSTLIYTGIACYVAQQADPAAGLLPLYRYYSPYYGHFYTTNWSELGGGENTYTYEGIQCYVAPYGGYSTTDPTGQGDPVMPTFRFYNTETGAHRFMLGWQSFYNYWVYNNPTAWTYESPEFDVWMTPYPVNSR